MNCGCRFLENLQKEMNELRNLYTVGNREGNPGGGHKDEC